MSGFTYIEGARRALAEELERDPRVWALGEDLGRGGVFKQYDGLQARFGETRVVDTPISEATIMGAAVGAALVGSRPVVEMRFSDFALCAVDELVNQAAKNRFMFGGQGRVPLVVRQPIGVWRSSGAQHSQSLESWWVHIPGLVVTAPATPADAYALLKAAIRCDDPVVHLEHKALWPLSGAAPESDAPAELGRAAIRRPGRDVTIVAWSAAVHEALEAARLAAMEGVEAEVIDLRSLWPWDADCVLTSVARTRRLIVAQEAVRDAGFGAEIVATVTEALGDRLEAKPVRLGAPRIPVGYSAPLEAAYRVGPDNIARAITAMAA
ncbi:alpha-ketoacid dehydrogenase subunit beta [Tistrella mobilis]|uniref:Pyruvate dehydrogenase E1 beta subunit n=1 Tax=Tistrella mobilis (strain KA081020-065) TaxID=1110502 RepID=I3TXL4_TISMK|nr:transketolase C-terminal domain-containing protein [Tistrella mobilis]AFK57502.1 putative pyruvate dehydrogenase E1 beta subunit [Tistrella mobilis KA081020-065]